MITRFNYVKPQPRDKSEDDVFYKWTYEKRIKVLNSQKDGSADNYIEDNIWKKEKCSWSEFIKSFDIGSIQDQVMNHLTKGTPLVTTHTLPAGDYTNLEKGAEIKREMAANNISLEMLVQALQEANKKSDVAAASEVKEGAE